MYMHTHAGSAFDKRMTLTFHLLTSGSMHDEQLPSGVIVYQELKPFSFLERGHTDIQTHTQSQTPLITPSPEWVISVLVLTASLQCM